MLTGLLSMLDLGERLAPRTPIFYGWVILFTAGSTQVVHNATASLTIAVLIFPLSEELGWSRTLIAGTAIFGGLAASAVSPGVGWLVDRYGSRLVLAVSIFILGLSTISLAWATVPVAFYLAYGVGRVIFSSPVQIGSAVVVSRWMFATATGTVFLVQAGVNTHLAAYLRGQGLNAAFAGFGISLNAAFLGLGSIVWGWATEPFPARYVVAAVALTVGISSALFVIADSRIEILVYAVLFGFGVGGLLSVPPVGYADYYGRRSLGVIPGVTEPLTSFGQTIGAVLAGLIFDSPDSYQLAFMAFAVMGGLATVLVLFARSPSRPSTAWPTTRTNRRCPTIDCAVANRMHRVATTGWIRLILSVLYLTSKLPQIRNTGFFDFERLGVVSNSSASSQVSLHAAAKTFQWGKHKPWKVTVTVLTIGNLWSKLLPLNKKLLVWEYWANFLVTVKGEGLALSVQIGVEFPFSQSHKRLPI